MSFLPDARQQQEDNIKVVIEICNSLNIESHPISTFNALSNLFAYKQEMLPYLKRTKEILENAKAKIDQVNAVKELCNVASQVIRGITNPVPLVVLSQDLSSYNIEALITFAGNLLNELNNAVRMRSLNEKVTIFENIVYLFRSLLIRLKESPLHDEIEKTFGINEDNIIDQIMTDDYSTLIRNMIEKIGGALTLIITHFK